MLTRRDQLKLKDEKAEQKKNKDKGKGNNDVDDKEKGTIKGKNKGRGRGKKNDEKPDGEKPEPKPKAGRKRKETEKVEEPPEKPEEKKPRRAAAKSKAAAKPEVAEVAEVASTRAPKAKARGKAKAKAKAAALPSLPVPVVQEAEEEEEIKTPKKKLFQSDDEDGEEFPGFDERDIMAEQVLQEVKERTKEEKKVKAEEKKRKGGGDDSEKKVKSGSAKAKAKSKSKATKKAELSPFTKKEVARRRKAEKDVMETGATEDVEVQAIFTQHLKNVSTLQFDGVKKYLQTKVQSKFDLFTLNAYWNRPACGTKCPSLGDGTNRKAPEISYFGKFNPAFSWNWNMALAYISASLMVSCHVRGVVGQDGKFRAYGNTFQKTVLAGDQ